MATRATKLTARQTDLIRQMARGARLYYGYAPYMEHPTGVAHSWLGLYPKGNTVKALEARALIKQVGHRPETAGFQRGHKIYELTDLGRQAAQDVG